ncbi:MAG: LamG-like jellyroll fold domain-containing protein [Luteibaculaceae bacterium]
MKNALLVTLTVLGFCFVYSGLNAQTQPPSYAPTANLVSYWGFNGNINSSNNSVLTNFQSNSVSNGVSTVQFMDGIQGQAAFVTPSTNAAVANTGLSSNASSLITVAGGSGKTLNFWLNPSLLAFNNFPDNNVQFIAGLRTNGGAAPFNSLSVYLERVVIGSNTNYNLVAVTSNDNVFDATAVTPFPTTSFNQWMMISVVFTPTNLSLYQNGVMVASATYPEGNMISPADFSIGGLIAGNHRFSGYIDELYLYNRALTPTEINSLFDIFGNEIPDYAPADGLANYWSFDGNINSTDFNTTTVINQAPQLGFTTPAYGPGATSDDREALVVNYTNEQRTGVVAFKNYFTGNDATINVWAKLDPVALVENTYSILAAGRALPNANPYNSFGLAFNPVSGGRLELLLSTVGGPFDVALTYPLTPDDLNNWVMFTAVYDGAFAKIFRNGVEVASAARTGNIVNSNSFYIGGLNANSHRFKGSIDELYLYNRALSVQEIQAIYNGAIGNNGGQLSVTNQFTSPAILPCNFADLTEITFSVETNLPADAEGVTYQWTIDGFIFEGGIGGDTPNLTVVNNPAFGFTVADVLSAFNVLTCTITHNGETTEASFDLQNLNNTTLYNYDFDFEFGGLRDTRGGSSLLTNLPSLSFGFNRFNHNSSVLNFENGPHNNYIEFADEINLPEVTLSFYVLRTSGDADNILVTSNANNNQVRTVGINANNNIYLSNGTTQIESTDIFPISMWSHVVISTTTTTTKIWVNGMLYIETTNADFVYNTTLWPIKRMFNSMNPVSDANSQGLRGRVDELSVHAKAVNTQAEVDFLAGFNTFEKNNLICRSNGFSGVELTVANPTANVAYNWYLFNPNQDTFVKYQNASSSVLITSNQAIVNLGFLAQFKSFAKNACMQITSPLLAFTGTSPVDEVIFTSNEEFYFPACEGQELTLGVEANQTLNNIRWFKNSNPFAGEAGLTGGYNLTPYTSNPFTIASAQLQDAGHYFMVAENTCGLVISPLVLVPYSQSFVPDFESIISQEDGSVTFTVSGWFSAVRWFKDNVELTELENQLVVNFTQSGDYYALIGFLGGCLFPTEVVSVPNTVSVSKIEAKVQGLSIYPNPTKSVLNIQIKNAAAFTNAEYQVTDLSGKLIFKGRIIEELTTLKLQGLTPGLYLLNVYSNQEIETHKIVVCK